MTESAMPSNYAEQLESFSGGSDRHPMNPAPNRAAISQAISLKRIADRLETLCHILERNDR